MKRPKMDNSAAIAAEEARRRQEEQIAAIREENTRQKAELDEIRAVEEKAIEESKRIRRRGTGLRSRLKFAEPVSGGLKGTLG